MTKTSDKSAGTNRANYTKDLFFWVCNFHGFLGPSLLGIYFLGYHDKCLGRVPLSSRWSKTAYDVTISQES